MHWEKELRPNKHGMAASTLLGTGLFIALFVFLGFFLFCDERESVTWQEDRTELGGRKKSKWNLEKQMQGHDKAEGESPVWHAEQFEEKKGQEQREKKVLRKAVDTAEITVVAMLGWREGRRPVFRVSWMPWDGLEGAEGRGKEGWLESWVEWGWTVWSHTVLVSGSVGYFAEGKVQLFTFK